MIITRFVFGDILCVVNGCVRFGRREYFYNFMVIFRSGLN